MPNPSTIHAPAPRPPRASLQLQDLAVTYPGFRLGPLSLTLEPGERVAIVGPNGAGKTTTMKALAGRLADYEGVVRFGDDDMKDVIPEVRARIGFLPERLEGFGWMTVEEHLDFLRAFFPTWDHAYARELCRRLDVPLETRLARLSAGTKVKVSLIAAEAHRPPVLLLDEPTSGIDPVMRGEILRTVATTLDEAPARLLVFSTHLLEDVERVARRVILIRAGRVVADRSVAELTAESPGHPLARTLYDLLERHE